MYVDSSLTSVSGRAALKKWLTVGSMNDGALDSHIWDTQKDKHAREIIVSSYLGKELELSFSGHIISIFPVV